jgi:hypothetical protein
MLRQHCAVSPFKGQPSLARYGEPDRKTRICGRIPLSNSRRTISIVHTIGIKQKQGRRRQDSGPPEKSSRGAARSGVLTRHNPPQLTEPIER